MTVRLLMNVDDLSRCPQCGVAKPNLIYRSMFKHPYDGSTLTAAWFFYECSTCHDMVAFRAFVNARLNPSELASYLMQHSTQTHLVLPEMEAIDENIPDRPKKYLSQALASIHAPDGAIMLAGSAIDAMLKIKGYEDGSVYTRIEKAVEDHVLTEGMRDWAHAVRLESNKPRHADLSEPHATAEMARQTIKFVEALAEFLFVLPARIARGKADSEGLQ